MISEQIKKIIKGYLNKIELPDIEVGRVVSIKPLLIQIPDLQEPIGMEFLIVPRRLVNDEYEIEVSGLSLTHNLVDEGTVGHSGKATGTIKLKGTTLETGDNIAMVKAKGGQKYLIMDKLEVFNDTKS